MIFFKNPPEEGIVNSMEQNTRVSCLKNMISKNSISDILFLIVDWVRWHKKKTKNLLQKECSARGFILSITP